MNMKRRLLTVALLAMAVLGANAQAVLGYSVAKGVSDTTPLADAKVVYDATASENVITDNLNQTIWGPSGIQTSSVAEGYPLGFTVKIGNTEYTNFLISGAGYVYLGNGEVTCNPLAKNNFMNADGNFTAVGVGNQRDAKGMSATKISYVTNNNSLTIQYESIGQMAAFWGDPSPINMWVKINADGTVAVSYSNMENIGDGNNLYMLMGVRQGSDYVCAVADGENAKVARNDFSTYQIPSTAPAGTTFTFNPPTECVTPAFAPSGIKLSATSTEITGSFDPVDGADTYLVAYSANGSVFSPIDGAFYGAKQDMGNGVSIAYFGPNNSFSVSELTSSQKYSFQIFAANSYGVNGPKYSVASSASITTLPAAPSAVSFGESTLNSITLSVTPNAANDDVVVLYNSYCQRDNYGDHGLFGALSATAAKGDVLPIPAGYEQSSSFTYEGMPQPANGGIVAYAGKAGQPIVIDGLEPSTGYYIAVYSRNADGVYSSDMIYDGASTLIATPYDGNSYNMPRYRMPFGWTSSPAEGNTVEFVDQAYARNGVATQGTQLIQQFARQISKGKECYVTLPPVVVESANIQAALNYCITLPAGFRGANPYSWTEGDQLAIRVSADQGATWDVVGEYNLDNHPEQAKTLDYNELRADLTPYAGKTILVQAYFKSMNTVAAGATIYIDRISFAKLADTSAPANVEVSKITESSAVVSWTGAQSSYKVSYRKVGSDVNNDLNVEGTTCTLTGLDANTQYEVMVAGQLADGYTECSPVVAFSTTDYPAVDAPENLSAAVKGTDVTLAWDAATDAVSYEVAYRKSSETAWVTVATTEPTTILKGLAPYTSYKCKVRAICTHDRVTPYSGQISFTTDESTGIEDVNAVDGNACYFDLAGRRVVNPAAGAYVRIVNGKAEKVIVK